MSKCLTCGEPVEQKKGKRKRLYCSDTCRLRAFQAKHKKRPTDKKQQVVTTSTPSPSPENLSLYEQLRIIENEKLPDYIKSEQGRVLWQQAQRKKINDIKNKLKNDTKA